MGGCAICARSFWVGDLHAQAGEGATEGEAPGRADAEAGGCSDANLVRRYAVSPKCAEKVNKLLDVRRYHRRWPKIPLGELYASSVQHPHVPEWRWLLHTRRVPSVDAAPGGSHPTVPACKNCALSLSADTPKKVEMPRHALANDNWNAACPSPSNPVASLWET